MSSEKIDLSYLLTVGGDDMEFVREMLDMFLNSAPIEVNNISTHFASGDYQAMASAAHKIKAPIQMMGEHEMADIIIQIETIGKNNEGIAELPNLIAKLKIELEKVIVKINDLDTQM
ncbi:MAG: Hpt domain-containing protein [Bacteroidia bacterium]|jgi:HPt (histidine-containing phosphotransfer) domain-containing protein|nr:Hpt domain-containing protein [Bacteroidia bacterium]